MPILRIPLRMVLFALLMMTRTSCTGAILQMFESRINDRFVLRPYWYDIRTYPHP